VNESRALLNLNNLSKTYGTNRVLDNFDLTIFDGEFFTLLGPSGCGKTTVLRMIAGLEDTDTGDIQLDGHNIGQVPAEKRPINTVFQSYALFPHMTVFDNVAFGLRMSGVAKEEIAPRVTEALEMVRLGDFAQRKPAQLSGGQQQRVAIARALILGPRVLICDEPTSALDVSVQAQIINLLLSLKKELGLTMVFVSHNLAVVEHLADHVAVMYLGQKIEEAGTDALFENPCHPYTRALLAATLLPDPQVGLPEQKLGAAAADPFAARRGCLFAPRCPDVREGCVKGPQELRELHDTHVRCERAA